MVKIEFSKKIRDDANRYTGQFYKLKPNESEGLLNIKLGSFEVVEQPYSILIDSSLNEVSLYEQEYLRRFIYIGNSKSYRDYKKNWIKFNGPFDKGRISEVYKSLDELLNDIHQNKIRKSFIDEIKKRGHVSFPSGMRC